MQFHWFPIVRFEPCCFDPTCQCTVPLVLIYVTHMLFFACGLIHKRRCNPPMSGDATHQCPRQHTSEHRIPHGSKTLDEPAGLGGLKRWEKRSGVRTAGRGMLRRSAKTLTCRRTLAGARFDRALVLVESGESSGRSSTQELKSGHLQPALKGNRTVSTCSASPAADRKWTD